MFHACFYYDDDIIGGSILIFAITMGLSM